MIFFSSLITTSELIISYFKIISWDYKIQKTKNKYIIINYILGNKDSVGKADNIEI